MVIQICQHKGFLGFYSGFLINLIRILPCTAIMFVFYEKISDKLNKELIS
jgi:hypothetical protein